MRDSAEGVTEKLCALACGPRSARGLIQRCQSRADKPAAIFVTAMDSEPLAGDAAVIIADAGDAFAAGLAAIAKLTEGKTYLCQKEGDSIPGADVPGVEAASFSGPHPAGLAGTHIHFLEPLAGDKQVWTIGYQDVIAIGRLMQTGHLDPNIVIALSGPGARLPRLIRTVMGASTDDLTRDEIDLDGTPRIISGSILSGHAGRRANRLSGPLCPTDHHHPRRSRSDSDGLDSPDAVEIRFSRYWARPFAQAVAI